mgnify:CR=1 FL=1
MRSSAGTILLPILLAAGCGERAAMDCSAPFVLSSVADEALKACVCEAHGWAEEVASVPGIGEKRIVRVPAFRNDGHPDAGLLWAWTTDEWLFGARAGRPAVVKMPGESPLADWGREHIARLLSASYSELPATDREDRSGDRFDKGGAVMASPPTPAFPNGRLIVAKDLHSTVKDFLRAQAVQTGPCLLYTSPSPRDS